MWALLMFVLLTSYYIRTFQSLSKGKYISFMFIKEIKILKNWKKCLWKIFEWGKTKIKFIKSIFFYTAYMAFPFYSNCE